MAKPKFLETVPVGRIFLALENPRHEIYQTEAQAIEYLCDKENVAALARDIAKNGLNPLERFALIPAKAKGKTASITPAYTAAEGNRRLCAIKLLIDPDLAPARLRKSFEKLAEEWTPIKSVAAAVFPDAESVRLWLYRVHNGAQNGVGRRDWNADQKQRFSGGTKNKAALALLDYAEKEGFITAADRKGKLTTAQRFLGNEIFRETLGLDATNPEEALRTRPKSEFDIVADRFVKDLIAGKHVHSRMNKQEIIDYARPLNSVAGVTGLRIEPEALASPATTAVKPIRKTKQKQPERAKHITHEQEIETALQAFGNEKLRSLYYSMCNVELEHHTPLVAIGTWSFFETLTALAGRGETVAMDAWLSKRKLAEYGIIGNGGEALRGAMGRIRQGGNTTKHDKIAAIFNGDQLNNDVAALKDVILKAIAEAAKNAA